MDGSGFLYRAFYGVKQLARRDGFPTNAIFGFLKMIRKVVHDHKPEYLGMVFDAGGPVFRHGIYPEYKANRQAMPDDLKAQVPVIRRLVSAWNVPIFERGGHEADDLIATLARAAERDGWEVVVVTGDKDLSQIVSERIRILDPGKEQWIGPAEVQEKWGVPVERLTQAMALIGDTSDNIPGVPGVGPKLAAGLIGQFGDLETLFARVAEVSRPALRQTLSDPEVARLAWLSLRLVTVDDAMELPFEPEALKRRPPDREALRALLTEMEFLSELRDLDRWAPAGAERVTPPGRTDPCQVPGDQSAGGITPPGRTDPPSDPLEPTGELPGSGYRAITDAATWAGFLERLRLRPAFALDTETTGLDPSQAELVGLSIAWRAGEAWYIPVGHVPEAAPDGQLARERVLADLKPILEDPRIAKHGQNSQFEYAILRRYGITLTGIGSDTMLLSGLLHGQTRRHNLDALALAELGRQTISFKEVAGVGKKQVTFDRVALSEAVPYACEDAEVAWLLTERMAPRLAEVPSLTRLYETVERPLIPVLGEMELAGALVDRAALERLSEDFSVRRAALTRQIHDKAGLEFNINSTQQLGEILFNRMGIKGGKRTKTGFSTDVEVLTRLSEEGHELPGLVLEYRGLTKLQSTYTDALTAQLDPRTGRIHTRYNQAATLTGRLSSSDPNLQNIPVRRPEGKAIRAAFIAPPGSVLLSADYSQIELRLLAHLGDIPRLKAAFEQGLDIHAATAAELFGSAPDQVDAEARRLAKTINFGLIYGMSPYGLAKRLGISVGEAFNYMDLYFSRYNGVKAHMERTIRFAREHGYVETLGGRRCFVADIDHTNRNLRELAERTAINAPLQGSAADLIKLAMIRLQRALRDAGLKSRLILQVHDELVLEVPETELEQVRSVTRDAMEQAMNLSVPLRVDMGVGANWAEAH
ncbi:DNA polymerase I [Candidatus Magnetaquicoccaceae bacterium FCR-1]|uniref:DNA polymerase I n=2 Tax=Candidatus Magnetaquiglobus chichijimensis TaxID=3141448 RepID=A0ABQ0C6Q0_9PROT